MPKKPLKPDEFSTHEILDRSYLASEFFNERIAEHEGLKANPRLRREAAAISQRLCVFYQAVGAASLHPSA